MGEDEVDGVLRKIVKGGTLGNDIAEESVIFLNKRLLGGTHGIAEEERDFMFSGFIVFKGKDVGELSAVVAQESIEQGGNGNACMTQERLRDEKRAAPSAAVLESISRPIMKLQEVK